jgi:hypothetical protein
MDHEMNLHKWLAVAAGVLLSATPAAADGWKYNTVLYGWFTGLDGTLAVGRVAEVPVSASFEDIAGYLDFAAAVHFEARNPRVVLIADVFYAGLGAEREATVAKQTVEIDMDLDQWILEGAAGYRVTPELDVILAGRYYMFDLGGTATGPLDGQAGERSVDWGDVYMGARYSRALGAKWFASIRGDVGVGGSDFAWLADAAVGYRFNERFSAGLAYRWLSLDYETGSGQDYFGYDMTTAGLGLALGLSL